MKKNPLTKGVLTHNSAGVGLVSHNMVLERARELAVIAGRKPQEVSQADYHRAKRELTGGSDTDPQDAMLEALPETKRWDPIPGSSGHRAPESPSEDEDSEGRSETEQLVDEGVQEAERDRMLQAARAAENLKQREP